MSHCERFEERLALHVENDLSADESAAVERHVAGCSGCREYLATLVESQSLFQELRGDHPPVDVARAVRRRVLDQIEQDPGRVLGWGTRIERALVTGWRLRAVAVTFAVAFLAALVWISTRAPLAPVESVATVEAPEVEDVPREVVPVNREPTVEDPRRTLVEVDETDVANFFPVAFDWNWVPVEIDIPPQRTVKLVTDNPKVIIYWVLEEGNLLDESTQGGGA